jgi:hypothetical protein
VTLDHEMKRNIRVASILAFVALALPLSGCADSTTREVVCTNIEAVAVNVGIPQAKAMFCDEAEVLLMTKGGEDTVSSPEFRRFIKKEVERACYDIVWKNSTSRLAALSTNTNFVQDVEKQVLDRLNSSLRVPDDKMAKRYAAAMRGFEIRHPIIVQNVSLSKLVVTSHFDYHESEVVFTVIGKRRAFEYGVFVRKPGVLSSVQLTQLRERVAAIDVKDITGHNFSKVGERIKQTCSAFLEEAGVKGIVTQHADHVVDME